MACLFIVTAVNYIFLVKLIAVQPTKVWVGIPVQWFLFYIQRGEIDRINSLSGCFFGVMIEADANEGASPD